MSDETMRAEFEAHVRTLQDKPPFDRMTEPHRAAGEYASWAIERDWRIWQAAVASRAPSAEAKDAELLRWVERCVNHHAHTLTPQEVLGMIQHHPSIEAITRSYADVVVPETNNPWKDAARLDWVVENSMFRVQGPPGNVRVLDMRNGLTFFTQGHATIRDAIDAAVVKQAAIAKQEASRNG